MVYLGGPSPQERI